MTAYRLARAAAYASFTSYLFALLRDKGVNR